MTGGWGVCNEYTAVWNMKVGRTQWSVTQTDKDIKEKCREHWGRGTAGGYRHRGTLGRSRKQR